MSRITRALLLVMPFLDELTFGFITLGLPLLRDRFHLSYVQAGLLFTAGALSSLVIEPPLNLLSDRGSKRPLILAGMVGVALAFVLLGVAPSYLLLLVACILLWPFIGAASLAQAVLIDASPAAAERTMTRWTLLASVGDLLSPVAVALIAALSLGWPALCLVAAAIWLAGAVLLLPRRFQAPASSADEDDASPHLLAGLRLAFTNRTLLRWVIVALLADMMDEVFLAFAGLYLHDHLGYSASATSILLGANLVGGLLTLIALDRFTGRIPATRLLPWLALVTLAGVALLLVGSSPALVVLGLFITGAAAAGWYPLATAAAYTLYPGRSGMVRVVLGIGEPYNIVLPGVTGFIAARFGITAAVAFLGLSGVGVLLALPRRSAGTSVDIAVSSQPISGR